jgi:adenylosuccinate lyase
MRRIDADENKIRQQLNEHWEVVSEGAQTILRAAGRRDAYESLKSQTRGRAVDQEAYQHWVESLEVDEEIRERLLRLSPETYIGLATQIVDSVIAG